MRLHSVLVPVITATTIGGAALAGFATRDRWLPHVFPSKTEEKPAGGHTQDHGHDHAHDHGAGDRVKLTAQAQANLGLQVEALVPREYWRKLLIPGAVVDRPGESDRGVTA